MAVETLARPAPFEALGSDLLGELRGVRRL